MNILIVAHFCGDFDKGHNNRFNYIAEMMAKRGHSVELITSSFSHLDKKNRQPAPTNLPFSVTMIEEPPYKKNVSVKRLISHAAMARNLKKYFQERTSKPDVIYCGIPSPDIARCAANYALGNGIRFIIDVQDLWPEAFEMVLNAPPLTNFIYSPMRRMADAAYRAANEIVAVSQTYAMRAASANRMNAPAHSIFLGTNLAVFDSHAASPAASQAKPEGELWIGYVGTMGSSYDIPCAVDAIRIAMDAGHRNLRFVAMGDGPHLESYRQHAIAQGITADFTGQLPYPEMVRRLTACDIAVNPIRLKAAQSIINKHGDYAAAGIPVVNTQECPEYRDLLDTHNAGLNAQCANASDMAEKLQMLIRDPELRRTMGQNHRRMAEALFDRARTYDLIAEILERRE